MRIEVDQSVPVFQSYAAERTRGLYNVEAEDGARFRLRAEVPVEGDNWTIGMIVGPSGSGKSSIARELVQRADFTEPRPRWSKEKPVIEVLGKKDYARATAALAAVGLGSVPAWLRPYSVLSTGERFRADLAALLLHSGKQVLVDEFTSALDRRVAQVGAGAFARSWRRAAQKGEPRQAVLVTAHHDVVPFVMPDWLVETGQAQKLGEPGETALSTSQEEVLATVEHDDFPGAHIATLGVGGGQPATYRRESG